DDFGQYVDRTQPVIELTPAMVGDIDAVDAKLDRLVGILDRSDAFQDQRDVEFRPAALDIAPVEPRLKDPGISAHDRARPARPAAPMALGDVALAPAVPVSVDGDAERVITGIDRTTELVVDPIGVAQHIELKNLEPVTRCRSRRLETGMGHTAQD